MPRTVIHDHGGHVDDILSSVLLWLSPEIDLQAIGITNSCCYADQSFEAMIKVATYLDLEGPEISYSEEPCAHPLPDNWRRETYIINELPLFGANDLKKSYQKGKARQLENAFADCLLNSKQPLAVVVSCPMTNIARLLRQYPAVKDKISDIYTMGGALNVAGNVDADNADEQAEWNIYADPVAFKEVVEAIPSFNLVPLDVTNTLPVTPDFLAKLQAQTDRSRASLLAVKLWSMVRGTYFWNTVVTASLIDPEILTYKEMKLDIGTQGKAAGKATPSMFGRKVKVAARADRPRLEQMLLENFARI
jgi:purine nucleosidase